MPSLRTRRLCVSKSSNQSLFGYGCFVPSLDNRDWKPDAQHHRPRMAADQDSVEHQFAESVKLEKAIRKNMKSLGFELPVGGKK